MESKSLDLLDWAVKSKDLDSKPKYYMPPKSRLIFILSGLLLLSLFFLATSQQRYIWPLRNNLYYHSLQLWWSYSGLPIKQEDGTLEGVVQNEQGQPISEAWVLLSWWDGTTYYAQSDSTGHYRIDQVAAGWYRPVAGASHYQNRLLPPVAIGLHHVTMLNVQLSPEIAAPLMPADQLTLSPPTELSCPEPIPGTAQRFQVHFNNAGSPNQLTLFYLPITPTTTSWPILLTIYPGPVDSWDCASVPLAAAGYAVIATGPAYSFEIESQIDELERLINLAQIGAFPHSNGRQIGLLGGSFSSIHVLRLIERRQDVQAALLLGPPTDMFTLRQRFEAGTFQPPFGLDQVMIAAGLPSDEIMRYWRYSAVYHAQADFPPIALLHSRTDEVVPFEQTELLAQRLEAVGASYESYFFAGASHYLLADGDGKDSLHVYQITVDFLNRQLKK